MLRYAERIRPPLTPHCVRFRRGAAELTEVAEVEVLEVLEVEVGDEVEIELLELEMVTEDVLAEVVGTGELELFVEEEECAWSEVVLDEEGEWTDEVVVAFEHASRSRESSVRKRRWKCIAPSILWLLLFHEHEKRRSRRFLYVMKTLVYLLHSRKIQENIRRAIVRGRLFFAAKSRTSSEVLASANTFACSTLLSE